MPLDWPPSPSEGDTYTLAGRTWTWSASRAKWEMNPIPSSTATPQAFMQSVQAPPWVETLTTSYPGAVTGAHSGALLDYI